MDKQNDIMNLLALDIEKKIGTDSFNENVKTPMSKLLGTPHQKLSEVLILPESSDSILNNVGQEVISSIKESQFILRAEILKITNAINYKRLQCSADCYSNPSIHRKDAFECLKKCSQKIFKANSIIMEAQQQVMAKFNDCYNPNKDSSLHFNEKIESCYTNVNSDIVSTIEFFKEKFNKYI